MYSPLCGTIENGKVAEWFNAPVLKTGEVFAASEGSTPSLSGALLIKIASRLSEG